ncbi:MAG TPA: PBP1A family penicillin-binding protein [Steroidobacteraceae bacterium]|nr:PBP1A family penicillin-binding protein [Steroidobacteraceae bacterium]
MKPNYFRLFMMALMGVTGITLAIAYAFVCSYVYLEPTLPSVSAMKNNELAVPLRVYTRSGDLIAQIGEQRRNPVKYEQIPLIVRQAFIAAEDDRFFEHHGYDWQGILRTLFVNATSGELQGASTITMQAARSAFFTQERTVRRKLQEIFVTNRLEHEFSKQEILALYLNVIFFGQRAYGVAAAAETYFGKQLDQLTIGEAATLARVPQWPSRYNPITDPRGAAERRQYVLRRMRELGFIDQAAADAASQEVVSAKAHRALADVEAPYIAEMVRQEIISRFGPAAQDAGYKVYTTIDGRLQTAANHALRVGLIDYTQRHGWRGAINKVELSGSEDPQGLEALLDEYGPVGLLQPAIVVNVAEKQAQVYVKGDGVQTIDWAGMSWAKRRLNELTLGPEPKSAAEILARGDVVYVAHEKADGPVELAQLPDAESALVALDPNNGAILSLVGGFDFFEGQGRFNRATMARRQPGSGFKPFMYAAALAGDFTPASVILDAPIIMDDPSLEEVWRPENSEGGFGGPTRLREALVRSRNLVSIRLLQAMGVDRVIDYVQNFGFTKEQLKYSRNLTLALGSFGATPLEVATGFAVFANGGYKVEPFYIDRIEGPAGQIVYTAEPHTVCAECAQPIYSVSDAERAKLEEMSATHVPPTPLPAGARRTLPAERVISPQVSFLMNDIMKDVITRGTGRRALALGRTDLRGKTGTTNLSVDTWFNGFNDALVASVWVGKNDNSPLGAGEEGARTAVPIWVDYMREALRGVPEKPLPVPEGIIGLKVNATTGGKKDADLDPVFEYFRTDMLPSDEGYVGNTGVGPQSIDANSPDSPQGGTEPIF